MIKPIVPSMASYGDATLMLFTKTINDLIKADLNNKDQLNDLRNSLNDIKKELDYVKKAVMNYG